MMHEFLVGHSQKKSVLAFFGWWMPRSALLLGPWVHRAVLLQFQEGELGKVKKWGRGSENCVTECFWGHSKSLGALND
jgi:hypothetical protein